MRIALAIVIVLGLGLSAHAVQLPMPTVCTGLLVKDHKGLHLTSSEKWCNGIIPKRLQKDLGDCRVGRICTITGHPGGDYSDDEKDNDHWFSINSTEAINPL